MATVETIDFVLRLEGQAAVTGVGKLTDALESAESQATRTAKATQAVESSTATLGATAGKSERVLSQLAQALGVVSPQAAAAARAAGDLAGGIELFAAAGTSALTILGPVAVAVGLMALKYRELAKEAKEAEDRMKAASDAATQAGEVAAAVDALRLRAAVAREEPGAQEALVAFEASQFAAGKVDAGQLAAAQAAVADATARLVQAQQGAAEAAGIESESERAEQLARSERAIAGLNAELAGSQSALTVLENQVTGVTGAYLELETAQQAQKDAKEAAKALAEVLREQEAAAKAAASAEAARLKDLAANFLEVNKAIAQTLAPIGVTLPSGFKPPTREDLPQLSTTQQGLVISGPSAAATSFVDASGRTVSVSPSGVTGAEVQRTTFGQDLRLAAGAAGALAGGDALGALALAGGPVGAGVAGGLGVLQGIGEKGAEGVDELLDGLTDALIAALEALPEILSEVIPDFVVSLITEFLPALLAALPQIILAAVFELPAAIAAGIVDAIKGILPFGGGEGPEFASSDTRRRVGRFQEGGHVDRTGLALVHRGEEVIPASGAGSFNATAARGRFTPGGGVNIDMSGALIGQNAGNEILRLLEDTIGPGGTGSTTIAGLAGRAGI